MTSVPINPPDLKLAMDLITHAVKYRQSPNNQLINKNFQDQREKVRSRIENILSASNQQKRSSASKQPEISKQIPVYGGALNLSEEILTTILRKPDLHERINDIKEILTANLSQDRKNIIKTSIQGGLLILTIALGLTGSITGLFFSVGTLIPILLSGLAVTFTALGLTLLVVCMNSVSEFTKRVNRFTQLNDITLKSIDLMQRFAIDQYVILDSLTSYTKSISAEWTIIIMAIYGLEEDVIKHAHDQLHLHPFLSIVLGRINRKPINPDYKNVYMARLIDIPLFDPIRGLDVMPRARDTNSRSITLSEAYIIASLYQRVLSIVDTSGRYSRPQTMIRGVIASYPLIIPTERNTTDGNEMFKDAVNVIIKLRSAYPEGIPSYDPLQKFKSMGFKAMYMPPNGPVIVLNPDGTGDDRIVIGTHGAGANTRKAKTVAELRDYARRRKINLHGATKKADIIAIINKKK